MKSRTLTCITAMTLFAALALPVRMAAQGRAQEHKNHSRYKVIDLGTFGGPNSDLQEELQVINSRGMVVGLAETTTPDPYTPNCFNPECLVAHALEWQKGKLTDLGALPGVKNSGTNWISESGLIAGGSENGMIDPLLGVPEHHAVLWENGQIIDLGTLGGGQSTAWSVNSHGQVAGDSLNLVPDPFNPAGTQERTFLWEDGVMQDLGTLGGPDAGLIGFKGNVEMNESGQVVACSFTSSTVNPATGFPPVHPFLWDKEKGMIDLGSLGGASGCAVNLNNRGQVVGYSSLAENPGACLFNFGEPGCHPILWDRGVLTDVGTLGRTFGFSNWINETGEAVGAANTQGDQAIHGFLWKNGIMTDLGTVPGDSCSEAFSINSKGQIVRNSGDCSASFFNHAFLWEDGGPMVDLNTLAVSRSGMQLVWAKDINDRGEIAGHGVLPKRRHPCVPADSV